MQGYFLDSEAYLGDERPVGYLGIERAVQSPSRPEETTLNVLVASR